MRSRASIVALAAAFTWPVVAQHAEHATSAAPEERGDHAPGAARTATTITEEQRSAAFPDLSAMRMSAMMLEDPLSKLVLLDRLEWHDASGDPLTWDLDAWIGRDLTKIWIRSEGERRADSTERAELEVLWGKSFARWWDFLAGARYDAQPSPEQSWAAFGFRGTTPYRFEIEATTYLGEGGDSALRFEGQYDLLVTNRLVLKPLLELDWYGQSDAARGVGAGLSKGEMGLRLHYEFRREVAPYVGLTHVRKFGRTGDLAAAVGEDANDTRLVAGIRLWF